MNKEQLIRPRFLTEPRKTKLRSYAFLVHFYAGIAIGAALLLLGGSGSMIVFRNDIGFLLHQPAGLAYSNASTPTSLQRTLDDIEQSHPRYSVSEILGFQRSDGVLLIRLNADNHSDKEQEIFIERSTGQEIPGHPHLTQVMETTEDFHKNLLMGRRGRTLNGLIAVLFFAVIVSGAIVWWPGITRWRRGLTLNFKLSWKRINYDLHNVIGIACCGFLILMAITAALMATPKVFHTVFSQNHLNDKGNDSHPSQVGETALAGPAKSIDTLLSNIASNPALAGWQLQGIQMAHQGRLPIVELKKSSEILLVQPVPSSGQILSDTRHSSAGIDLEAHNLIQSLHFGRVGGLVTQVFWVILGVSPGCLVITGFLMWWNRVLTKKLRFI